MKENLPVILEYMELYRRELKGDSILNFYRLFGLEESISFSDLQDFIKNKRIKILFHPDLEGYLPEDLQEDFRHLSHEVISIIDDDFSNKQKKESYDQKLKECRKEKQSREAKRNFESSNFQTEQFDGSKNDQNFLEQKVILEECLRDNIDKHGFSFTMQALKEFCWEDYNMGFTRDKGVRSRMQELGEDVVVKIICMNSRKGEQENLDYDEILFDYFSDLIFRDEKLRSKLMCYVSGCTTTIAKYNQVFGRKDQCTYAISQFISKGVFSGFTNDNGIRDRLKANIDSKDGVFLTQTYLYSFREFFPEYRYDSLEIMSVSDLARSMESLLRHQMGYEELRHKEK